MRHACLFFFAITFFVAMTSAHAREASCDFRECMNICRSEYESGCTSMCGRIISLCRQLVPKPERTRSARRSFSFSQHEPVELGARVRRSLGRMD